MVADYREVEDIVGFFLGFGRKLGIVLGTVAICLVVYGTANAIVQSQNLYQLELDYQAQQKSLEVSNKILIKRIHLLELERDLDAIKDSAKAGIIDTILAVGEELNTDWKVKTDLNTPMGKIKLDLKNTKRK